MTARLFRILRRVLVLLIVVAATLLVARAWDSQRGPDLEPWHTYVPHDMHAAEIDKADWASWLKAEEALFRGVRTEVTDKLDAEARTPGNRYYDGSPIYPGHFAAGLESLLHPRTRRTAGRRRRPAARADRFALQPAPHRAPLPRRRLRRRGDQDAGATAPCRPA